MPAARNHTLDHIKAIACLTIVCHHLAFYGPMTDVLRPVLPALLQWLDVYGRMAVQVFLVLGLIGAVTSIAGHYVGSGLAIKNGSKIVRPTVVIVLILLAVKVVYELITK